MARKKQTTKAERLADQSVALAEYAAKVLVAAEQLRIKKKVVEGFPQDENDRPGPPRGFCPVPGRC